MPHKPYSAKQLRAAASAHRLEADTLYESVRYLPPTSGRDAKAKLQRHRQLARELEQAAQRKEATAV